MKISVIISTYNAVEWLEKSLWGFRQQTDRNFDIVIADDGSDEQTRSLIDRLRQSTPVSIKHVWQNDHGFRKCRVLNKAIGFADGEYLVMTDGDCIPRKDFVATHRRYARDGFFLSGGYFKLPMSISQKISMSDIENSRVFDSRWLMENGLDKNKNQAKLNTGILCAKLLNFLTPTKPTWNGHNSSCFKSDALLVNGFDERMRYGGEDCEFGDRLKNASVKARQIRYSAICVHLEHERGYSTPETRAANRRIRKITKSNKIIESPCGIRKPTSRYDENSLALRCRQ